MTKFKIVESRPATQYWIYTVEAETETEALNLILDGNINPEESWTEESEDDENSDYEIEQID
jgi:hypothetical protein